MSTEHLPHAHLPSAVTNDDAAAGAAAACSAGLFSAAGAAGAAGLEQAMTPSIMIRARAIANTFFILNPPLFCPWRTFPIHHLPCILLYIYHIVNNKHAFSVTALSQTEVLRETRCDASFSSFSTESHRKDSGWFPYDLPQNASRFLRAEAVGSRCSCGDGSSNADRHIRSTSGNLRDRSGQSLLL